VYSLYCGFVDHMSSSFLRVTLLSQNLILLVSHFILDQAMHSAQRQLGTVDLQGCGHRIFSGGVGMPGPHSAGIPDLITLLEQKMAPWD
ncbi:hypothetical protein HPG69_013956, partial [Diceros bicornis minor]